MRNVIAALVAVAAVAAVVWFGWSELSVRTAPEVEGPGATAVLADFVTAFDAGDVDAMTDLVHPDDRVGLDGLVDAADAMRTELDLSDVSMTLGEVDDGVDRAVATTTVTITLANLPGPDDAEVAEDVGTIGWLASLQAIERRSGWFVQPDRSSLHPQLTGATRFRRQEVDTPRASILAADGSPLTIHGDLETLGIEPRQIRDRDLLRDRWAEVLPQSLPQLEALLARDDLTPDWFYAVVSLPSSEVEAAWARLRTLPSVIRKSASDAGATPTSTTASHVLGTVGAAGDELAQELGVEPDQVVGLNGLERVYEDQLVGSETVEVILETTEGALVEQLGAAQVDPSMPVTTSLDATLQASIEAALLGVDDELAVVAVRTDGGIAASASRPLSGYNRTWQGLYPPGDLFLPISAGALIRSGRNLDTRVTCPREVVVAGARAESPRPLSGEVGLGTALAAGCDTAMAPLAVDLAPTDLVDLAAEFGWGRDPGLPLTAATPTFPTPVDSTEVVRAALGQARVQASPLHLATVAASTLSGQQVIPWLVVDDASEPRRLPLDTSGIVDVFRASTLDGSGATISERDIGVLVGTAPVTGSTVVHSWSMMLVDDLGIVVLVEDTGGNLDLVRRITRRIEGELVARGTPSPSPSPAPTATSTTGGQDPATTPGTPQPGTPQPGTPQPGTPQPGATTPAGAPTSDAGSP